MGEQEKVIVLHTKCELMEGVPLTDHHDVFGTFVPRSFLQARQILVMALSMYQSQIVGTLRDQLDQNCAVHARTIESAIRDVPEMLLNVN